MPTYCAQRGGSPPFARRGHPRHPQHLADARLTSAYAERAGPPCHRKRTSTAHLCSREEGSFSWASATSPIGSPPLARRGQNGQRDADPYLRLTSARAERTAPRPPRAAGAPAHLRSRGEDAWNGRAGRSRTGSPPLTRRGPRGVGAAECGRRLTSARAERTATHAGTVRGGSAHLRSRGEDAIGPHILASSRGSPPLARRGPAGNGAAGTGVRLTSARAERTCAWSSPSAPGPAHLRSRGDDVRSTRPRIHTCGSPPLARRGRSGRPWPGPRSRLTSARAERTRSTVCRRGRGPAHLRSRGEDAELHQATMTVRGSPPLARRGLRVGTDRGHRPRLTSAGAERTRRPCSSHLRRPAHLRSRGEDARPLAIISSWAGSPPLARTGLGTRRHSPPPRRLISACAERATACTSCTGWTRAHLRLRRENEDHYYEC
jgi:hypothetical protein